jgi:hypothetical protein
LASQSTSITHYFGQDKVDRNFGKETLSTLDRKYRKKLFQAISQGKKNWDASLSRNGRGSSEKKSSSFIIKNVFLYFLFLALLRQGASLKSD